MKIETELKIVLIMTLCTLLLTACSDTERQVQLQNYLNTVKIKAANEHKVPVLSKFQMPTRLTFPPNAGPTGTATSGTRVSTDPLKNYPLKSLRFIGTISEGNVIFAYVQTPDKMTYPVSVGAQIGSENATVTKIDSAHIEVSEQIVEPGKPVSTQIISLQLKE